MSVLDELRARRVRRWIGVSAPVGACGAVVATAILSAGTASATAVTQVPCSVGGSDGLIAAINAADKAGAGTLELAKGCTYTLTTPDNPTDGGNGLPVLTGEITINGSGGTTIARSSAPGTPDFRIIEVAQHGNVSITNLTITGGLLTETSGSGGGIDNEGIIGSLTGDSVRGNAAPAGGGIYNNNLIGQITHDHISDNTAHNGGGVFNLAMIRTFTKDVVSGNRAGIGGGITSSGTIQRLTESTISHNHLTANGAGGGIANSFGLVMMSDDTISDNTATGGPQASGGGIDNSGKMTLTGSVVTGNKATALGGGIRNDEQAVSHFVLTIKSTKVTNNAAHSGGGIYNDGAMTVAGTEVHANKANEGGGLLVDSQSKKTALDNSHINGNHAVGQHPRGGGIFFDGGAPVTLVKTEVTGNHPENCFPLGKVAGCSG